MADFYYIIFGWHVEQMPGVDYWHKPVDWQNRSDHYKPNMELTPAR